MLDDGALLREYADARSETAFAELVRRHLDLVYSTALRRVGGDEHLAKDISQNVFIDLARKARGLSQRTLITGWLYTSACFAAAKAIRTEQRRQAREHQATSMHEHFPAADSEPNWQSIQPLLDSAMLELKAADREALLLRYFERRPLAEVGRKLGLTENAARMRVDRALEKLRDQLARQGVTSTAVALALVLTSHTVVAAPATLASAISSVSVATAAAASGSTFLTLIAMTKSNAIVLGLVLAAGAATPIILQHQANQRLNADLQSLREQVARKEAQPVAAVPTDSAELDRLRRENQELLRLRGEVTALRNQLALQPKSSGSSADDQRKMAMKKAQLADDAQTMLAKSPDVAMMPRAAWTNQGFASPIAALQTLNWATRNGDTNAFLNALSWDPQARARADALFAALPDSVKQQYGTVDGVILDWWLNQGTPIAGYRVLSQTDQGPDDTTLVEQHQYVDGRVRENSVNFHRDDSGGWRQVIPPELMPKLENVVNNLAQTQPRTLPYTGSPAPSGK